MALACVRAPTPSQLLADAEANVAREAYVCKVTVVARALAGRADVPLRAGVADLHCAVLATGLASRHEMIRRAGQVSRSPIDAAARSQPAAIQ
jgi:hypothetical protein